jgi:dihydroorotate dehydrogenase
MTPSRYELVGHEIESPLVNAAGSINGTNPELILREVDTLASTAIGAITVGSFTMPRQEGNEAKFGGPVYYHDKDRGETYNSMGLPNIGMPAAIALMPQIAKTAHYGGKPVIASVSPTQASAEIGNPLQQIQQLANTFSNSDADLVEIDTSSPNTVTDEGGRNPILGYNLDSMEGLVALLESWAPASPEKIGVKLPPYITDEEKSIVPDLAELFNRHRVFSFVTATNTIPNRVALDESGSPILSVPGGMGGMSGPATKEIGRDQLGMWTEFLDDEIEIISTLGVDSGKELAVRRELGAAAAGGVTFLWESDDWGRAVTDVVTDWAIAEEQV